VDHPYRTSALPSALACPRCEGVALVRRGLGHVHLDECPRCTGVFVATEVLDTIVEDLGLYGEVRSAYPPGPIREPKGGRVYLQCPRCKDVMNRRLFAPSAKVIVDVCRAHGTWFDARELPAVVAFVEGGGLDEARRLEAERKAAARAEVAAAAIAGARAHDRDGGLADLILDILLWRRG
jgi:Zn-finger nucleic acid-binding protein